MTDIKSMTIDELKKLMTTLGDKPFSCEADFTAGCMNTFVTSYDEMTIFPKA